MACCQLLECWECHVPMIPHDIPNRPWEKLGADYFSFAGKDNLLVIDYISKYPEVIQMNSKTAEATVNKIKQISSRAPHLHEQSNCHTIIHDARNP